MQPSSDAAVSRNNLAPIPMECDAPHLKIVGELPRELNGTLYRNGPNPQFDVPGAHWFVGDGMLHAFHLENGRASYRNRWVRTPKWQAEHDAGRALFGGFGRKLPDAPPTTITDGGVANTNIIFHGGRLLALEEGHLPTEIEPGTLKTRGYVDYDRSIAGPFTAHPKIDPVTGEMIFFGYNAAGPLTAAMSFGAVGANGVVTRFDRFQTPYASMVHDFIVTENHVLFPILPLTGSMDRAMSGKPPYAWEPDKGSCVGVMKRNGAVKDIVWFRGEACYVFHVMNAWEDGNRIIADVMQFEEAPLFPHPDGRRTDPREVAGETVPLDVRPLRQHRPLHARLSRRRHRRIPAHRRPPRRFCQHATAGTPAPTRTRRSSAGSPASCTSMRRRVRAARSTCCPTATRSPSRCSSNAAATPPRATAGCSPSSGAPARTAATSPCSTQPTSPAARWRWCNSATACRTVFTGIGWGRINVIAQER